MGWKGRGFQLGLNQDGNDPPTQKGNVTEKGREMWKASGGNIQTPFPWRYGPDEMGPVWSQSIRHGQSGHWTQHCLFYCSPPLLSNGCGADAHSTQHLVPLNLHWTLPHVPILTPPVPPLLSCPSSSLTALVIPSLQELLATSVLQSCLPSRPLVSLLSFAI